MAVAAAFIALHLGIDPLAPTIAAMAIGIGIPGYFFMRWWSALARAAGIPRFMHSRENVIRYAVSYGSLVIVSIVVEGLIYGTTHSRVAQGAFGLCVVAPLTLLLARSSYRRAHPAKPQEAKLLAFNAALFVGLPIIFTANLFLQINARHIDIELDWLRQINIDGYFVMIPTFPILAYFMRQRSVMARNAQPTSLTT